MEHFKLPYPRILPKQLLIEASSNGTHENERPKVIKRTRAAFNNTKAGVSLKKKVPQGPQQTNPEAFEKTKQWEPSNRIQEPSSRMQQLSNRMQKPLSRKGGVSLNKKGPKDPGKSTQKSSNRIQELLN